MCSRVLVCVGRAPRPAVSVAGCRRKASRLQGHAASSTATTSTRARPIRSSSVCVALRLLRHDGCCSCLKLLSILCFGGGGSLKTSRLHAFAEARTPCTRSGEREDWRVAHPSDARRVVHVRDATHGHTRAFSTPRAPRCAREALEGARSPPRCCAARDERGARVRSRGIR